MMRVKQAEVILKLYMKMKETRHVQHLFNVNSPQYAQERQRNGCNDIIDDFTRPFSGRQS